MYSVRQESNLILLVKIVFLFFVEDIILYPWCILGIQICWPFVHGFTSGLFILFHWPIVLQSWTCVLLCHAMNCSTPVSSVLHYLSKFAQIHVHCVGDAIYLISSSCFSFCLQSFLALGSFPMSWLLCLTVYAFTILFWLLQLCNTFLNRKLMPPTLFFLLKIIWLPLVFYSSIWNIGLFL